MEWPNETVLEFLEHYENEPIIWNPSVNHHRNRNEVYDAWKRIENKMGNNFSVTELKKKKDSLMASFRACLKKVKDSNDLYRPNWFAYEIMERFLKDKNQSRESFSLESNQPDNMEQVEEIKSDLTEYLETGDDDEDTQDGCETMILPTCVTTPTTSVNPPSRKRFKATDDIEIKRKMYGASTGKNLCDIYGELVAAKLKAMDELSRELCMHRIDNILFEMRMSKISGTADNSSFLI